MLCIGTFWHVRGTKTTCFYLSCQGALLANAVLQMEEGKYDEAIGLMFAVANLPNRHFTVWAHFFLGLLYHKKGTMLKAQASARGEAISGAKYRASMYDFYICICGKPSMLTRTLCIALCTKGDESGFSKAYKHYEICFETASNPLACPALWARYHGAQLAVEFRESAMAMKLMVGMENIKRPDWDGISIGTPEGPVDGFTFYVSEFIGLTPLEIVSKHSLSGRNMMRVVIAAVA